jgi:hypothetical protein
MTTIYVLAISANIVSLGRWKYPRRLRLAIKKFANIKGTRSKYT